jgi:hypothetical protein
VRLSVWRRVNMAGGRDNPDFAGCQREFGVAAIYRMDESCIVTV